MTADEAVRAGFHCIKENIPADRLNDVLHKFGTVAFDSRPLAGIDALVDNRVRTELVCTHNRAKTDSLVLATFCYAQLFYQEGDFRRTIEILEPIVLDYQSFSYTPKLISCFNLMGVASHCETEYSVSRYFYRIALKIAQENGVKFYYSFEYNNIALSYIAQEICEDAIRNLLLAEEYLPDSDEMMGAYISINKANVFQKLGQLPQALQAYTEGIETYQTMEVLTDDTMPFCWT